MNKLRVIYATSFNITEGSGRHRATRQKLHALRPLVEELCVVCPWSDGKLPAVIFQLLGEVLLCIKILSLRPDVLITRGSVGFLAQKIAASLSITTVREVHGYWKEEVELISESKLKRIGLRVIGRLSWHIDRSAKLRIFNHPSLMELYKELAVNSARDGFVYNGFSPLAKSELSKSQARRSFGLSSQTVYCVFTGSVASWHGAEYLIDLQKEIDRAGADIVIVVGGGKMPEKEMRATRMINISPLGPDRCADLIQAADICLLPVKINRSSPGNPLKLYDYILHRKFVLAQIGVLGYSDEVEAYGRGAAVDFSDAPVAAANLVRLARECPDRHRCNVEVFSWSRRMSAWLELIERVHRTA